MKKPNRQWFFVGSDYGNVALIDLTEGKLEAYIEPQTVETGNSEEDDEDACDVTYELLAVTGESSNTFPYDPEDESNFKEAVTQAVKWVELTIGPPVIRVGHFRLFLNACAFWKYKTVWANGKLVALSPIKRKPE
jgi:hypothetical protein